MLSPEAVSDLYARLPQLRKLPGSIYVVDGTIEAPGDPYQFDAAYADSGLHRFNAELRAVQQRGSWVIRGLHNQGSPDIVVSSTAPESTWVHEATHLQPVIGPNETLTRARTSMMMRMAQWLPPVRKVRYVEAPVSSGEASAFTTANNLHLVSGPGGVRKYVRAQNYDSVWVYEKR